MFQNITTCNSYFIFTRNEKKFNTFISNFEYNITSLNKQKKHTHSIEIYELIKQAKN